MDYPLFSISKNVFQVKVSIDIFSTEAINASCYKYSGNYFVYLEMDQQNKCIIVTLQSKDNQQVTETVCKEFCNDLIDQQLRVTTNDRFGHIRDMIVEEAFKPVQE